MTWMSMRQSDPHLGPRTSRRGPAILAAVLACGAGLVLAATAADRPMLPSFDFRDARVAKEWGQPHDLGPIQPTADGLELSIRGADPYLFGPARDYPANTPLWLIARLRSDQAGSAEVFYFRDG